MTEFYALSDNCRSIFGIWTVLLLCGVITGILLSGRIRRIRYAVFSLLSLVPTFLLWQVITDLRMAAEPEKAAALSFRLGALPWSAWLAFLILLTIPTALAVVLNVRYTRTAITPLSIKQCADRLSCGICYWRDNGHVIFSNESMNRLCIARTEHPLLNGNTFRDAVTDGILTIEGCVWNFTCRDLVFDGELLHEMIAWDVTELQEKTEALQKENAELSQLNAALREYSLRIDETVRQQEVLQAKVKIHDEMNRLMLSTIAADSENTEEIDRILALWEQNALLLCMEADERKNQSSEDQISTLAQTLDISLIWKNEIPDTFTTRQREFFNIALWEAITNAVKHAQASQLEIDFAETASSICCSFTNAVKTPQTAVRFTGGLENLRLLAEERNAEISVETGGTEKTFRLFLTFAKASQPET